MGKNGSDSKSFSSIVRTDTSVRLKDNTEIRGPLEAPCLKAPKPGIVRLMVDIARNLTPARGEPNQHDYEV